MRRAFIKLEQNSLGRAALVVGTLSFDTELIFWSVRNKL